MNTTCADCNLPLTQTADGYWIDAEDGDTACPVSLDDHRPTN